MSKHRNLFWDDLNEELRFSLFEEFKQNLAEEKVAELINSGHSLEEVRRLITEQYDAELSEQADDRINRQGSFGTLEYPGC